MFANVLGLRIIVIADHSVELMFFCMCEFARSRLFQTKFKFYNMEYDMETTNNIFFIEKPIPKHTKGKGRIRIHA